MIEDFIDGKIAITVSNAEVYLLDELNKELDCIVFASGDAVNSRWFKSHFIHKNNEYIVCNDGKIYFGNVNELNEVEKRPAYSITKVLKLKEKFNINDTDFEAIFVE